MLLVLALLGATQGRVILDVDDDAVVGLAGGPAGGGAARVSQWATRAHDWLLGTACADVPEPDSAVPDSAVPDSAAGAGDLCRDLVQVPRAQIRVYAAGRGTGAVDDLEPVMATLVGPEGGKPQGPHDAVLVLDPYPAASFGHLVLVFFVALGTTEERCGQVRGLRLGKLNLCYTSSSDRRRRVACRGSPCCFPPASAGARTPPRYFCVPAGSNFVVRG